MSFCGTLRLRGEAEVSAAIGVLAALRWHLKGKKTREQVVQASESNIHGVDGLCVVTAAISYSMRYTTPARREACNLVVWEKLRLALQGESANERWLWCSFGNRMEEFTHKDLRLTESEGARLVPCIEKWLDFLLQSR